MDFNAANGYVVHRLRRELKPSLSYHCLEHTLDVLEAVRRLAELEHIDPSGKKILETAAIYHDTGMLVQYKDHEAASVVIARETLPGFGYSRQEINEIAGLILITKLPQRPTSHYEEIICDADLDYLGRDDFYIHSFRLQREWKLTGIKDTNLSEWLEIQIKFLTQHQYFTNSAISLRTDGKLRHLEEILRVMNSEK